MRLENKVAIVTGAAQGMGFATAKLFTQQGARVAMIDVNTERLLQAAQAVEPLGKKPLTLDIDISDSTAVSQAVQKVYDAWKRVDVLVNNAAIQSPGGNFVNATDEVWDRYLAVNVKSAGFLVREVIPLDAAAEGWKYHQHRVDFCVCCFPRTGSICHNQRCYSAVDSRHRSRLR